MSDKSKFNKGDKVFRQDNPGRPGEITGRTRSKANDIYYQVDFSDGMDYVPEYELEVVEENKNPEDMIEQGLFGRVSDLRRNLTHTLLSGRLSNMIYSLEVSKTDFYAHQFKPVLAFLESPSRGLLIADEVGLGKTIEAGLIWTELRVRYDYRQLLVVCPAMLREKWRDELRDRFGVDARIMDATELLAELKRPQNSILDGKGIICSIQGISPQKHQQHDSTLTRHKLEQFFKEQADNPPIIDLLIVDEAHYMRNPSSQSAKLGKMLRDISENVLLLSATPINLRSDDLFSLLNLVDPDTFAVRKFFPEVLHANEPLVRARELVLDSSVPAEEIQQCLEDAANHPFLANNSQLKRIIATLEQPTSVDTGADRVWLADQIEKVNLYRHVLNRTRKAEVIEWNVVRRAKSQFVDFHGVEREFYDNVTDAVRSYAEEQEVSDGFLLASPQRQVSSCLYAAAKSWRDKKHTKEYLAEMIYEDMGGEVNDVNMLSPFMDHLTSRVLPVDLLELRKHDSKFNAFYEVIEKYLNDNPQEKIVVFSYFRATLFYLEERLSEQSIASQVLVGGMKGSKQDAIDRFREADSTRVLLSSEVASEGVDLQFCRVIVNYDLPWNPMKIEQRIGRLDRIGQKAEKITIWNFGHVDTIDHRIYERLLNRLKVFERALGGMEAVLGEKIKQLTADLASQQLTRRQQESRIDQTAIAIENNRQTEEHLEKEASNLIAHSGYILERVKKAHEDKKGISNEDLIVYIRDYLNQHARGHEFRQPDSDKSRVDIRLPADIAAKLGIYIEQKGFRGKTMLATGDKVTCEFINKLTTIATRGKEQINQFHPLVRFISAEIRNSDFCPVVVAKLINQANDIGLSGLGLDRGQYAFVIDIWRFGGLHDVEDMQVRALHIESDKKLDAEESWKLLNAVRLGGTDWPEAKCDIPNLLNLNEMIFACGIDLDDEFQKVSEDKKNENEDRINLQITSAERHRVRQLESLKQVLENYRSSNKTQMIPATEGRIEKIKRRFGVQIKKLEIKKEMTIKNKTICRGAILLE